MCVCVADDAVCVCFELYVQVAGARLPAERQQHKVNINNTTLITHVHETFRIADIPAVWE